MDIRQFYEELLGRSLPDGDEVPTNCFCGNHRTVEDANNSCSINMQTGLWSCHANNNKGGGLYDAIELIKSVDRKEARKYLADRKIDIKNLQATAKNKSVNNKGDETPIKAGIIRSYIKNLVHSAEKREFAADKFGWDQDTLNEFEVGYDLGTHRYAFPVKNAKGDYVNVRLYDPVAPDAKYKMLNFANGYGMARLWPLAHIDADTIILTEGEKDCILMNQVLRKEGVLGMKAMTVTAGAGVWRDEFSELFKNKHVIICFDLDDAGIGGAHQVAVKLLNHARDIKVIRLDVTDIDKADITDYFTVANRSLEDFQKLILLTDFYTPQTKRHVTERAKDTTLHELHLGDASAEEFLHKQQHIKVLVAGKDLAPYAVPKKVTCKCELENAQKAKLCPLALNGGIVEKEFEANDPVLVKMVGIKDTELDKLVERECGVRGQCCMSREVHVEEFFNVEEVTLQPEIDFTDADRKHVSRTAYIVQHGVEANRSYDLFGTTIPHPRSQHVVHFSHELIPAQDSIDDFQITPEQVELLKIFQPKKDQSVRQKFDEIANDLSYNVTKIYGRDEIIIALDLCYHTVLGFDFQGAPVAKAWGDILIIGDTRTGKTETTQGLVNHYRLGEVAGGENASFAGLVGGLRQESGGSAGKRWNLMWGKIPLNDRRLIVIDEVSGLDLNTIGDMSGIRSNGLAEITKIVTEKTLARTRMVWLSNPRNSKAMAQYAHGVEAVKELMGRPEDIARFDFVVVAAFDQKLLEVIHQEEHKTVPHVYTSELCRTLVLWAWSRKREHIVFTQEATRECLTKAMSHARQYASSGGVPLVEGGSHRIKLAKLAVAAAIRTFSTEDGETVIVTKDHVTMIADFIDELYKSPALDYHSYSEIILNRMNVSGEKKDEIKKWVREHGDWAELWLMNEELRLDDFRTMFDLETHEVKTDIFRILHKNTMIERNTNGSYAKTPAFISLIKEIRDSEGLHATETESAKQTEDEPF